MPFLPLRYQPYEATETVPNVVVDGSPNAATELTLSHWPGLRAPVGATHDLAADLSAQMAFRYVDFATSLHGSAAVVTNNHFDQDGLISMYALSRPSDALRRRALLEDVAAAGDFATFRDRRAARLSMSIAAYADRTRSPLAPLPTDYGQTCAVLYSELLGRLPALVDRLDDHRSLWQDEDRELTDSQAALAGGDVVIEEHAAVDLAVVTMSDAAAGWSGHRFAGRQFDGIHPMALNNATDRFALLLVRGRRYCFTYRYETWVQYRSRRPRLRVDLSPLAAELTSREAGNTTWQADPVGELTPQLRPVDDAESSISSDDLVMLIVEHLNNAPAAWNPYEPSS